ncbi:hypothetical protein B0T22DRAFT_477265 [Podospora appendiculata]|uniref:MYND-type domain-containing protein n=1 Tax=Podospora appendiculata TaxID=314037 RepID=A0AAE1CHQ1_9PEZI|nr:hypothetical protein B0T22DRAFT_477265 [Podospora appendiculata]
MESFRAIQAWVDAQEEYYPHTSRPSSVISGFSDADSAVSSSFSATGIDNINTADQPPTEEEPPTTKVCASCGKTNFWELKCSQCRDIGYCSMGCRDRDRSIHNILCGSFQHELDQHRRNSKPDFHRVILFPENNDTPRIIWLRKRPEPGPFEDSYDYSPYFNTYKATRCCKNPSTDDSNGDVRTQELALISSEDSRPYRTNRCIQNLAIRGLYHEVRGPIIAVGSQSDITARDFRCIVDHIQSERHNIAHMDPGRYSGPTVQGVKINSLETRRLGGEPRLPEMEPVSLTPAMLANPLMEGRDTPVKLLQGSAFPLTVRTLPETTTGVHVSFNRCALIPALSHAFDANDGKLLLTDIERMARERGANFHTCILMRQDQQPLYVYQVVEPGELILKHAREAVVQEGVVTLAGLKERLWPALHELERTRQLMARLARAEREQ